jgi:hypothetical protein
MPATMRSFGDQTARWFGKRGASLPKGPDGQKRPADAIGRAVMVARIATGEAEDNADESKAHHRRGGQMGGAARAAKLTAAQRSEIARKAAQKRWSR